MDIKATIEAFEKDATFFLRNWPELHKPLLKIAKKRKPDAWVEEMPLWLVPAGLIKQAIAVAPQGLLFISEDVDKKDWVKIAKHEKLEMELVNRGYKPNEAHRIALEKIN